ncbi:DUF4256 domain-containing protein [Chthonobacter albigriseus]|uniref:DUF4256 domain-containing protein n=1 Tax=Chthonobacter albigriseus TaxID=1683161 RepID=UPI0015EF11F0|nr:DUF4256 domain-containing protein [Chthonobacter albigriseus]
MESTTPEELLGILKSRFTANPTRHADLDWQTVESRLLADAKKLQTVLAMERTGGEPDVVRLGPLESDLVFCDCSPESPADRRSLCYDDAALESRKENKPRGSAMQMAAAIGVEILSEQQYRTLQTLGAFDRKTSSWVLTPTPIRTLGGALFCDRRYNQVFVYHNGAESYYAARGFRGCVAL